jgi:alpha-beta hydrolase superfamily lysophospholipase
LADPTGAYTIEEQQAGDGYRWKYRKYHTPGTPRGIIIFIHGIQSHAGWYENSCLHLSQAGFQVYFLDRRGAGVNAEDRGDTPSFRRLLDDLAEFLAAVPRTTPHGHTVARLPVFLAGISWGGKLAVALERRHPGLIDGLALLCPGFFSRVRPTLWQRLGIFFSRLFRPRRKFPIPLNDPELFTASPRWHQFLREDPLRLHHATARLFVESLRLDGYLRFSTKYVHVPVLVLLAGEDRIIRNDKTKAFVGKFATPDKQIIEYPAAHHTLEFEPAPHPYLHDLQAWMEKHAEIPTR